VFEEGAVPGVAEGGGWAKRKRAFREGESRVVRRGVRKNGKGGGPGKREKIRGTSWCGGRSKKQVMVGGVCGGVAAPCVKGSG